MARMATLRAIPDSAQKSFCLFVVVCDFRSKRFSLTSCRSESHPQPEVPVDNRLNAQC
jgi:hypothetical protein